VLLGRGNNAGTTFFGRGTAPLKFGRAQNVQKIGAINDNFRLWPLISLKKLKMSTSGKQRYQLFFTLNQKIGELWSTNTKDYVANVYPPKSTVRVLRILMHWSSGHVTLLPGQFYPPNPPQLHLRRRADSRWAFPQIFSFFSFFTDQFYFLFFRGVPLNSTSGLERLCKLL